MIQKRYSNKNTKQLNPELDEIHGQNNQITAKKLYDVLTTESWGKTLYTSRTQQKIKFR